MADVIEISDRETPFSSHESDEDHLWDAIEILKERKHHYLVKWAGVDEHGKPWPDSWANKRDCTDDMVQEWKRKKAQKALKKKETKRKTSTARNSTVSATSKASTSRLPASAAPSTRSRRSRTAVPDDQHEDDEKQYDSISRTPRKRRLSKTPVLALDSDSNPPTPPPRPLKKRKLLSENAPSPKAKAEAIEASRRSSSRKHIVSSSSDEMGPTAQPNGKGKAMDRSPVPLPAKSPRGLPPPRTSTLLQQHLDKRLHQPDYDELDDESPSNRSRSPPPRTQSGRFSYDRPVGNSLSQSNILSPRAQARLNRFDEELAAPTQDYAEKTPLFFPASSEEFDDPMSQRTRSRSRSHSRSRSASRSDSGLRSPSRSPPPVRRRRSPSPVAIDFEPSAPLPPRPATKSNSNSRPASTRPTGTDPADDSYRVGDVPETQSTHQDSPSQPFPSPSPKKTLKSQMKPRARTTIVRSSVTSPATSQALPLFVPIPVITASEFRTRAALTEDEEEQGADDELIEQFSSPEKGKAKGKKPRVPDFKRDVKGKGRAGVAVDAVDGNDDDEEDEEEAMRRRVRGMELAEAARAERRARMEEYAAGWKAKRTTISQIRGQTQQQRLRTGEKEGEVAGVSISTESDVPIPSSMDNDKHARYQGDIEKLRQEEEENTQDLRAFYQGDEDEEAENENGAGGDSVVNGDRSEAEDSARSVGDRSEDRETVTTDVYDIDVPERAAWHQEQASQQSLAPVEDPADSPQDLMQDDSMEENLLYPPTDDEHPSPQKPNDEEVEVHDEDGEIHEDPEDGEIRSQDDADESLEAQAHPSTKDPGSIVVSEQPPVVPNGRLSKSRSTSARPNKPADDAELELPPTASTDHNISDAQSVPVEPVGGAGEECRAAGTRQDARGAVWSDCGHRIQWPQRPCRRAIARA
ncbi:hypothetical protein DFH08DRAFT_435378 [Mycena albidolilacea]|uniref:Chromo domain-containing protein n=1 Tax=Mycena albidolilacea TaxID=1033008 RepID=A0AAD6Z9H2_9AGAR|nr:hypothetical protein DFH08DRAFT_435378 [Mycena albidolilacea]